jgi:translation initiation factor 4E
MKRVLAFPPETKVEWKSHDSSITQRAQIDEQRKEKSSQHQSSNSRGTNKDVESEKKSIA